MRFVQHLRLNNLEESTSIIFKKDGLEIAPGFEFGVFTAHPFVAAWLKQYRGFEYRCDVAARSGLDQPENIRFALRNDGARWYYDGSNWVEDENGWNTAAQMRSGIAVWPHPLQLQCRLDRYTDRDKTSPHLVDVRFGVHCFGSLNSYLMEFSLPEVIRHNVELTRWLPPGAQFPDVDSDQIASISTAAIPNSQGLVLTTAVVNPPVKTISSQRDEYQITETPVVLVEVCDTEDSKNTVGYESVRTGEKLADLYFSARQYHQRIRVYAIAQELADASAIIDLAFQRLSEQGVISVPAFGQHYALMVDGEILVDQIGEIIEETQLPSLCFDFLLLNLTPPELVREVDLVEAFDFTNMNPVS